MYTALARLCTRSDPYTPCTCTNCVHGRTRAIHTLRTPPCTRAVNTAVYTAVNTAVYTVTDGPCTWPVHGRVHSLYTAVGGRVQTVHGRTRPCTNCVQGCTRAMHMVRPCPEHGRVRSRYAAKHGRVRGLYPTVYVQYTRPCRARAVYGPCRLHGRLYGPCARPCTYHVHGRAWSVHEPNTPVYTVVYPVHGRVYGPCTRQCTVYMHVFAACVYGRPRPCTDCVRAMYMVRS